ncbi:MAG: hypothetical protein IPM06_19095 [Rhizobiales bacterium]|nr:hypothetical protein [Hyphomicrobiales bacterium]
MANSTTNLDLLVQSQASKEITVNAFFDAASPSTLYGRRQSTTTGLTWGYYGGMVLVNGVLTAINNGTVALTASATNYVEALPTDGSVSKNTSAFTAGRIPLYSVVTGTSTITSYTDYRLTCPKWTGRLALAFPSDANYTLTQSEASNDIISITAGVISTTRDFIVPLLPKVWVVVNNTAQSVRIIGASGTGITIATTKTATVMADGTNVVRVTADT